MSMAAEPKKRKNPARRTCIWVFGVLFVLISALLIHYRGVRPVLRVEYGTTPCASDLTKRDAELILKEEKPSRGWHFCNLSIGGVPTPVLLHVVDTIAPSAEAVNRTVPLGTELGPDAFVKHVKDADTVRAAFEEVPDFHHEWDGTIRIVLTDGAKNETVIPVRISVRATIASLTVEAGSDIPGPEAFLLDSVNGVQTTVISPEMLHHAGTYPVAFAIDGGIVSQSQLIVADTEGKLWLFEIDIIRLDEEEFQQIIARDVTQQYRIIDEPPLYGKDVNEQLMIKLGLSPGRKEEMVR